MMLLLAFKEFSWKELLSVGMADGPADGRSKKFKKKKLRKMSDWVPLKIVDLRGKGSKIAPTVKATKITKESTTPQGKETNTPSNYLLDVISLQVVFPYK